MFNIIPHMKKVVAERLGRPLTPEEKMVERGWSFEAKSTPPASFAEELRRYETAGVDVRLLSERSEETCEVCFNDDGTEYEAVEAMGLQPLPHDGCTCENGCGCVYLPAIKG